MALFTKKPKKETAPKKTTVAKEGVASGVSLSLSHVLKRPRITEKASMHQAGGVYTFDVASSATKTQIKAAVREIYKVTPQKVAIVMVPQKETRNMRTGRRGVQIGGKKAYVYLKKGETITNL